jgi:predicted transcriptional regulator
MASLRDKVRLVLRERGILQKTLAKEIGFSEAMVSLWLSEKIRSTNVEQALDLWLQSTDEHDISFFLEDLCVGMNESAIKEAAVVIQSHKSISSADEAQLEQALSDTNTKLASLDKDPVATNRLAFHRLRPELSPPVRPGEYIVVCDGEVKGRFTSEAECADYVITGLQKDCFVHHEPSEGEEASIAIDLLAQLNTSQGAFLVPLLVCGLP